MGLKDLKYSKCEECLTQKYLVPQRVVVSQNATGDSYLTQDTLRQPLHRREKVDVCSIAKGGFVVLDMGSEIQGGLEISVVSIEDGVSTTEGNSDAELRIVFGESISEAMSSVGDSKGAVNDHSTRDMTVHTTSLSRMRYGYTGYRFVKIESLSATVGISSAKGVLEYRDLEYKGTFSCNDDRLNKIYDTAAYTVHLCMQDYVWDGIKRDRLVWIGDFHPEMSAISTVFGHNECVEKTLDFARDSYPIRGDGTDYWMIFPSYSCWWIVAQRDWYMQNGSYEYLLEQKDYMYALANQIISGLGEDGSLNYKQTHFFVDWSSCDTEYMEAGFRGCVKLGLEAAAEIFAIYGDSQMKQRCLAAAELPGKIQKKYDGNKQVCAMVALSDLYDDENIHATLTKDLPRGMSTFYGYYVLNALAKLGDTRSALDVMRSYWGAMLDKGATTFWEDFDVDWLPNSAGIDEIPTEDKVDIHATYGKFCYQKLRLSLCHGWASGPAPFISRHILGVSILEKGCTVLKIKGHLGDLQWAEGTYPTPYGIVKIRHERKDGRVVTTVDAPEDIEVIVEDAEA